MDEGVVKKLDISEVGVEMLQLLKFWKGRFNVGCWFMVEVFVLIIVSLNDNMDYILYDILSEGKWCSFIDVWENVVKF